MVKMKNEHDVDDSLVATPANKTRKRRVAAHEVCVVRDGGPNANGQTEDSASLALNARIGRMEGLIAGELAAKIQQAIIGLPTKGDMTAAVNEAVVSAASNVVDRVVEPLLEEVAQLNARHAEEMQKRQAQHEADMKELKGHFERVCDEIARQNALTEQQLAKAEEKKARWWWPW